MPTFFPPKITEYGHGTCVLVLLNLWEQVSFLTLVLFIFIGQNSEYKSQILQFSISRYYTYIANSTCDFSTFMHFLYIHCNRSSVMYGVVDSLMVTGMIKHLNKRSVFFSDIHFNISSISSITDQSVCSRYLMCMRSIRSLHIIVILYQKIKRFILRMYYMLNQSCALLSMHFDHFIGRSPIPFLKKSCERKSMNSLRC